MWAELSNNDSYMYHLFARQMSPNTVLNPQTFRFYNQTLLLLLYLPDQIYNSPYCQPYSSYNVSWENLVLDPLIIPKLIFVFILITYLIDIVLIL